MSKPLVTLGLYRHFKGDYYYVQNIVTDTKDEKSQVVIYFDVLHPERGTFARTVLDFIAKYDESGGDFLGHKYIIDRVDNVTGQTHRFEKIVSLDNEVKNLSTESLLNELAKRADSPLQELDIDGLSKRVFCSDYVIGEAYEATDDNPKGVFSFNVFDDGDSAFKYLSTHKHKSNAKVFKRTFIEVDV